MQRMEGIVLRAIPFRDYDHILTLFTQTEGVVKLLVYASRSKRRGFQGICIPLTRVEVVYREKGGEVWSCQEMSLIESYPFLRTDLSRLEAACDLLHAISSSQMTSKPAPHLYALLCFFLERMAQVLSPSTLVVCFRLKLLMHDGLAAFPFRCSDCGQLLLKEAYTNHAEGWCIDHRPTGSSAWNQKNLELVYRLVASQNYREICTEQISPYLQTQVAHFFTACIESLR